MLISDWACVSIRIDFLQSSSFALAIVTTREHNQSPFSVPVLPCSSKTRQWFFQKAHSTTTFLLKDSGHSRYKAQRDHSCIDPRLLLVKLLWQDHSYLPCCSRILLWNNKTWDSPQDAWFQHVLMKEYVNTPIGNNAQLVTKAAQYDFGSIKSHPHKWVSLLSRHLFISLPIVQILVEETLAWL